MKLGRIFEAEHHGLKSMLNLSYSLPEEALTKEEVEERRGIILSALERSGSVKEIKDASIREILVENFLKCFICIVNPDLRSASMDIGKFQLAVEKGIQPIITKVGPSSPAQRTSALQRFNEWLAVGHMENSMSPYANALVPLIKVDSTEVFWCMDFRALNQYATECTHPLHVEEVSSQSEPEPHTPFKVSRWLRIPFGSAIGPGEYPILFEETSKFRRRCEVIRYLDDILICPNGKSTSSRTDPADVGEATKP